MKVMFRIDRMDNGDLVVYTKADDVWVRQGYWENKPQVVSFYGELDMPDAASSKGTGE